MQIHLYFYSIHYISEAYLAANPDYTGRFTVPALVDIPSGKVVNNDYFNLTLYFETAWKPYHKEGAPDLYPEDLREEIDKLNDIIFREVNNGVYKAGFARKQKAYDRAYNMVFNRLDWLEERLANQRYLFGDRLTESDVRLYVTLVRFDCAYYPVFRLNKKLLRDYPNLWAYARDLYQTPGFGDTTNFAAIKKHYHIDCCPSNEFAIVPNGPDETFAKNGIPGLVLSNGMYQAHSVNEYTTIKDLVTGVELIAGLITDVQ